MTLPLAQQLQLEAFGAVCKPINDQLAALRATRGQREVGSLKVPAHLQQSDVVIVSAPATTDPRICKMCAIGLAPADMQRGICRRCADNPSTDIGVERRHGIAGVLPL